MDIELQFALESFQRWFSGERLTSNEISVIAMSILLCVMLIVTIALLVYLSRVTLFWTRIGWFFEDVWHWLKTRRYMRWFFDPRYSLLACGPCFEEEDLNEKEIHEIMDMIYKGNPPKYEIKKNKNGRNFVELENQKK